MGVRIGARMGGLGAIQSQDPDTLDGDAVQAPDDMDDDVDKKKIGREPEREPSKDPNLIEEQKFQRGKQTPNGDPFSDNQYNIEDDPAMDAHIDG